MAPSLNFSAWLAGGLVLLAGLVCDVVIFARFVPSPALRIQPKPWTLRDLGVAAAVLFGLLLLTNAGYALAAHAAKVDLEALLPVVLPVETALRIVVLLGFALFFKRRRIVVTEAFGLDAPRRALGWGVVFGLASLPPIAALMFATEGVCRLLGIPITEQPVTELFLATDSRVVLVSLTVFALLVAPVFEEFLFRGFAYPALKERLGTGRALAIVSLAFAVSHYHAPSFIPLVVLAVGLALAYELTGSLLTSITMHSLFNLVMVIQLFYQRAHP
jgi:membrane protease YdiL (CAAX protease family)